MAICKQRPRPQTQPDDVPSVYTASIAREQWNPEAGYQIPLDAAWEGSFVMVWAAVDVGFQTFYSEPLELGQIQVPGKEEQQAQTRWGLFRGRKKAKAAGEEVAEDNRRPWRPTPGQWIPPGSYRNAGPLSARSRSKIPTRLA